MYKARFFITIIILFILSFTTSVFTQDDDPTMIIKFVDGTVYIREIGESTETQAMIDMVVTYEHILRITDRTECLLEMEDTEFELIGPMDIRVKDIMESYNNIGRINLSNALLNRVSGLYIRTNNRIHTNRTLENELEEAENKFKRIIEVKKKKYYEGAFTIGYEYIQDYRATEWRNRRRPNISRFYYIISEISYETLNLNIAEASMYKTINETQQNPNAVRSPIKDEYRQNSYILGALINSTKSNFNMSIDFLDNIINEFPDHQYFRERIGYLTYYLLGLNYLGLEQIESAKTNLNRALQMCNSSVNNNITVLKNLYLQERTTETEENINQYIIYLNEASLMIGYIKRALSEID